MALPHPLHFLDMFQTKLRQYDISIQSKWKSIENMTMEQIVKSRQSLVVECAREAYFQSYTSDSASEMLYYRQKYIQELDEAQVLAQLQNDALRRIIRAYKNMLERIQRGLAEFYIR